MTYDIFEECSNSGIHGNYSIGILIMDNLQARISGDAGESARSKLEDSIKGKYSGWTRGELKAVHPIDAYIAYYKKFGSTYHVLPQIESVIKGKTIPGSLPLVEAMFMSELKNMLLTAGHDLDKVKLPLRLDIAEGGELFTALSGRETAAVRGDIMISDQESVISSVLRGPDLRTAITAQTKKAVYLVYVMPGIDDKTVYGHLDDIEEYIRLFYKAPATELKRIFKG